MPTVVLAARQSRPAGLRAGPMFRAIALLAFMVAAAGTATARDNVPSDGTDSRYFLCMAEGGVAIPIPLLGTLCCNNEWCVVCDTNLNNCREITPAQARMMQSRPTFQIMPQQQQPMLSPN
ncbi:MAG: hypothetical protein ACFCVH_16130 [Alphaproteobacteria bacterium]